MSPFDEVKRNGFPPTITMAKQKNRSRLSSIVQKRQEVCVTFSRSGYASVRTREKIQAGWSVRLIVRTLMPSFSLPPDKYVVMRILQHPVLHSEADSRQPMNPFPNFERHASIYHRSCLAPKVLSAFLAIHSLLYLSTVRYFHHALMILTAL